MTNRIVSVAIAAVVCPLPVAVGVTTRVRGFLIAARSPLGTKTPGALRSRYGGAGARLSLAYEERYPSMYPRRNRRDRGRACESALVAACAVAEYLVALEVERQATTGIEFPWRSPSRYPRS